MTEHVAGMLVVLEHDLREDDAEEITRAIRQLRGVLEVTHVSGGPHQQMADERARLRWQKRLLAITEERS